MTRRRPGRGRARGATLLEVMISMALLLLALLGLFKALATSVRGSASANRHTQAQVRARALLENIMAMPKPVLDCLNSTLASSWSSCETLCHASLGPMAAPDACMLSTLSLSNLDKGPTGQAYALVVDGNNPAASSWVTTGGTSGHVYDVQITIGWNEDTSQATPPKHRVTFRGSVWR